MAPHSPIRRRAPDLKGRRSEVEALDGLIGAVRAGESRALVEHYDTLSLVWRHFPDPELHPGADLAAELSELAAVSGKFWQAHSLLLAGRESFAHENWRQLAQVVPAALSERRR